MENLQRKMERKERDYKEDIDYLVNENAKLRKKLGLPSDEDCSDDDDISIIDDEDEDSNDDEN